MVVVFILPFQSFSLRASFPLVTLMGLLTFPLMALMGLFALPLISLTVGLHSHNLSLRW